MEKSKVQCSKSILRLSVVTFIVVTLFLVSAFAPQLIVYATQRAKLGPVFGNDASATELERVQAVEDDNRTWIVSRNGTADFRTIQEAINAASPGDTISVSNGTYCENVVVNKTVFIIGQNKWITTINGSYADNTVWIKSNNVQISGFTITGGAPTNVLIGASTMAKRVIVTDNLICNASCCGMLLVLSDYDRIEGNIIQSDCGQFGDAEGIRLMGSSGNVIVGNTVKDNHVGIICTWSKDLIGDMTFESLDNAIYHNSFVQNTIQAEPDSDSINAWDDGASGNYWSNYNGTDLDHDGVGDAPYVINGNGLDNHPLMGMFSSFNTSSGERVSVVSNSTVEDFRYFESNKTIVMHVSNMTANQTYGFCRLTIPRDLISPPYNVTVNNYPTNYTTVYENESLSIIYIGYQHSTLEIEVIPEFPSLIILQLVMTITLLPVIAHTRFKERGEKARRGNHNG
jgi:nitrous oxidase accessory protein NosD